MILDSGDISTEASPFVMMMVDEGLCLPGVPTKRGDGVEAGALAGAPLRRRRRRDEVRIDGVPVG